MLKIPGKKDMQAPSEMPESEAGMEIEINPVEGEEMKPLAEYSVEELKAALAAKMSEAAPEAAPAEGEMAQKMPLKKPGAAC